MNWEFEKTLGRPGIAGGSRPRSAKLYATLDRLTMDET